MHPIFDWCPISGTWSGTVSPSQMCAVHFMLQVYSLFCTLWHILISPHHFVLPPQPWASKQNCHARLRMLGDQLVPNPCHPRYQRSARDSFWMETYRLHPRYRRSARPKTVPLAIPEISSRQFPDGNISVAYLPYLATVSGWKRISSTRNTGDQLVTNPPAILEIRLRQFLDGNVSNLLIIVWNVFVQWPENCPRRIWSHILATELDKISHWAKHQFKCYHGSFNIFCR